jgi:hypothetical protein
MRALVVPALVAATTVHHAACAEPIRIALIMDGSAEQASAARHGRDQAADRQSVSRPARRSKKILPSCRV